MDDMTQGAPHLSAYMIDRLLAGLLDESQARASTAHAETCARCAEQLENARAARQQFLAHNPPALRIDELVQRRRATRRWLWLLPLLPVAAMLILWTRPKATPVSLSLPASIGPSLSLEGSADRDPISLRVSPQQHRRVAIYSVDAKETWKLIVELELDQSISVPAEPPRGHETRYVAVFSEQHVDEQAVRVAVLTALRGAHTLAAMPPVSLANLPLVQVRSILVHK